jgi:hypothetical protein
MELELFGREVAQAVGSSDHRQIRVKQGTLRSSARGFSLVVHTRISFL